MRNALRSAIGVLCVAILACGAQAASQRELANDFIDDHQQQLRSRNEVDGDLDTMMLNLDDSGKLQDAVREFFNDRADIEKNASSKAANRDLLFQETNVTLPAVVKPPKASGVLQTDVQNFIAAFDLFRSKDAETQSAIDGINTALAQNDGTVLNNAVAAYFTARRERRNARDAWTAALKAIKKGVAFKSTLKAQKFDADSLKGYTAEYLRKRGEWVDLAPAIENDLNALRIAASAGSPDLAALTTQFLNRKKERLVKAQELQKLRASMLKNNPLKSVPNVFKGLFNKSSGGKIDEEEEFLDQSVDHVGV